MVIAPFYDNYSQSIGSFESCFHLIAGETTTMGCPLKVLTGINLISAGFIFSALCTSSLGQKQHGREDQAETKAWQGFPIHAHRCFAWQYNAGIPNIHSHNMK